MFNEILKIICFKISHFIWKQNRVFISCHKCSWRSAIYDKNLIF